MKIQKSIEDYLEAILMISEEQSYVRSVDVANKLGISKPSVSFATKKMKENGFIVMDKNNMISLTKEGKEIAKKVYSRHKVLIDFFISIGVSEKQASEDACKVEHDISEETFKCLMKKVR